MAKPVIRKAVKREDIAPLSPTLLHRFESTDGKHTVYAQSQGSATAALADHYEWIRYRDAKVTSRFITEIHREVA